MQITQMGIKGYKRTLHTVSALCTLCYTATPPIIIRDGIFATMATNLNETESSKNYLQSTFHYLQVNVMYNVKVRGDDHSVQ